jgi:D-alanyl-D-alanine carboxypeptidase
MKKIVGLLGLVTVLGGAAGGAIAWKQMTRLPNWYESDAKSTGARDRTAAARQVEQKLKGLQNPGTTVSLSSQELDALVGATLEEVSRQAQVPDAVRGIKAEMVDGKLKAGAVIDFAQLRSAEVKTGKQTAVLNTLAKLPGVADRQIYVGIASAPTVVDGKFELDPQTQVQIGDLQLSLADAAKYTGVSPDQLQNAINRAIPVAMSGVALADVKLDNEALVLRSGR